MQRFKKAAAAILGWEHPLLTFIYPGFHCGSCWILGFGLVLGFAVSGKGAAPRSDRQETTAVQSDALNSRKTSLRV